MPHGAQLQSLACLACGHRISTVKNSRPRGGFIYRRRKCLSCGECYSTREFTVAACDDSKKRDNKLRALVKAYELVTRERIEE